MIVTIANPKGGTGKTTLVRALSGTAAHAGNDVFLILNETSLSSDDLELRRVWSDNQPITGTL